MSDYFLLSYDINPLRQLGRGICRRHVAAELYALEVIHVHVLLVHVFNPGDADRVVRGRRGIDGGFPFAVQSDLVDVDPGVVGGSYAVSGLQPQTDGHVCFLVQFERAFHGFPVVGLPGIFIDGRVAKTDTTTGIVDVVARSADGVAVYVAHLVLADILGKESQLVFPLGEGHGLRNGVVATVL